MAIGDCKPGLPARKTGWLRLAPLVALGAIAAMLLAACSSGESTQTPESDEGQATSTPPTVEVTPPTPTPALTETPTPTPIAFSVTLPLPPTPTPRPTATPGSSGDDYGLEDFEQLFCGIWDGTRDTTEILPPELYPFNRFYHTAAPLDDGRIIVGGGFIGSPYDGGVFPVEHPTVDVYDPVTDSWCTVLIPEKPPFLWESIALSDGSLLLMGVVPAARWPEEPWQRAVRFDAESLTLLEVTPPAVFRFARQLALLDDGRVLVVGGWGVQNNDDLDASSFAVDAEIYDSATDSWTHAGGVGAEPILEFVPDDGLWGPQWLMPMSGGRAVFVTVGENADGDDEGRIQIYDATADLWSTAASFSPGRDDPWHVTLTPQGKLCIFYYDRVEIFDLESRDWVISYPLRVIPRLATTTVLPDGRILVTGGAPEGNYSGRFFDRPTVRTDILDPETMVWAAGPPMEEARHGHSATLLRDGSVLMYGGIGISRETDELVPLNSVEVIGAAVLAAVDTVTPPEANSPWATCIRASNTEPLPSSTREIAEPPYSAAALLDAAVQAVDALTSYAYVCADFRYTTQDSLGGRTVSSANCTLYKWNYEAPNSFEIDAHELRRGAVNQQSMAIGIGGDPYVYFSEDSGETWTRSDAGAEGLVELLPPHKEMLQLGVADFLTNLQITGIESLDEIDVYHVTGEFTFEGAGTGDTISYWIGVDDLLVRRIAIIDSPNESDDGDRQHFDEFYEFHSFNQEFNIQPPPEDQIADEDG